MDLLYLGLFVVSCSFFGSHTLACPQNCYCDYNKVQCNNKDFLALPDTKSIPNEVKWLDFNRNRIGNLTLGYKPTNIFPNATHFHLDYNSLKCVPGRENSFLSAFNGLQYLSLTHNRIFKIAMDAFSEFRYLQEIRLSYNIIRDIGGRIFRNLFQLRVLRLDDNQLQNIAEDAFVGLHNVSHLDLSSNQLETVRETWFENLFSLKNLHLGKNRISAFIPDSFWWPNTLITLDLHNNKLPVFPPVTIKDCSKDSNSQCWKRRSEILLQGNDIYCGCRRPEHNKTIMKFLLPIVSVCCIDVQKTCPKISNGKLSQDYSLNFFWKYVDKPVCTKPSISIVPDDELCKATGEPKPKVNATKSCIPIRNTVTPEKNRLMYILSVTCTASNIYGRVRDVAYFSHESCLPDGAGLDQDLNGTTCEPENFREIYKTNFYIFPRWSVISLFCMTFIVLCILIIFALN